MELSYLRLTPDARGSGSVVSIGIRGGMPVAEAGDVQGELLAASRSAVMPFADRRRDLVRRQTAAAAARDAAAQECDGFRHDAATAEATLFGDALTARLAELRGPRARAENEYHRHRVAAGDAADAIVALDNEAREAATAAATEAATLLGAERQREADELGRAIFARIIDDLGRYFAARDSTTDLSDSRTCASVADAALKDAGIPPVPRRGATAIRSQVFSGISPGSSFDDQAENPQ